MAKPAHHRGTYHVRAERVRNAANAHPGTLCWRCGRRLDQHPYTKTGKPPRWTAGHVEDEHGNLTGELAPEASVCNYRNGALKLQVRQGLLTASEADRKGRLPALVNPQSRRW